MERAIPILPIEDPDVAKQFYVDGLGFEVIFEACYADEPKKGTIIGLQRGTLRLNLDCPMPGHGRDACVSIEVEDADAYYEAWSRNVEIDDQPKNEEWGARTFGVQDPFGNTLFVVGPLTDVD